MKLKGWARFGDSNVLHQIGEDGSAICGTVSRYSIDYRSPYNGMKHCTRCKEKNGTPHKDLYVPAAKPA